MKNKNFIEVSKKIYYDEKNKKLKRGSTNKNIAGIGRLITLFNQYGRAYDLYSMPSEIILNRLIKKHPEFNQFNWSS